MGQSPEGEAVSDNKNGMEFHQGKICFGKKYLEESSSFTKHITKSAPKDSVLLCVRAPTCWDCKHNRKRNLYWTWLVCSYSKI